MPLRSRIPEFLIISALSGAMAALLILPAGSVAAAGPIPKTVTFRDFFAPLTFDRPVLLKAFPGTDSAYLVVQQSGAVHHLRHRDGAWVKTRFDSIPVGGANSPSSTDDGGLLGFAFHPDYASNRKYYVYYVASYSLFARPGRLFLEERQADSTLRRASGAAPRRLLTLAKPGIYHNGGTLDFGADGFLYTAIGDGGGIGDPQNRAQDPGVLFGKFLRLDVDGPDAFPADTTRDYAVPAGNPFVDSAGFLPEIWAYGLRSPWKWSFHPLTGEIWLGDVGQSKYEEVTRVPRGGNLGWRIREGAFCYTGTSCPQEGLTAPAFTFPSRSFGNSVTGGVFFRGDTASAFHGLYLFGDFGTGRVWAARETGGILSDTTRLGSVPNVNSLDRDARGRVFAVSMSTSPDWENITEGTGIVYVLESPDMRLAPATPDTVTGLPARAARPAPRISRLAFTRHPERYEFFGPDGRALPGPPAGVFGVREKRPAGTAPQALQLFTGF
jgi:glucose/arabinose dehydrogenase